VAIYSLHHTAIGKSTQAQPHTAAAHINYISRRQAMSHFEAARLPGKPGEAARYLRRMEDADRANARVVDKVMLALPRELSGAQRAALVRAFAEEVTKGKASWLAAFHDKGEDRQNPHCHLVIRDRDPDTGKRVIGMSDAGSTQRLRELWERHANRALEAAGRSERVDRRSLKDQGIKRVPTIHEGPRAQEMDARGVQPRSKVINARNGRGARRRRRQVDYRKIDRGQSRPEYNRSIRAQETETDFWAAIDADRQRSEFERLGYGTDARRREQRDAHAAAQPRKNRAEPSRKRKDTHPETQVSVPHHLRQGRAAVGPGESREVKPPVKQHEAGEEIARQKIAPKSFSKKLAQRRQAMAPGAVNQDTPLRSARVEQDLPPLQQVVPTPAQPKSFSKKLAALRQDKAEKRMPSREQRDQQSGLGWGPYRDDYEIER
jgi:hypothetical protein